MCVLSNEFEVLMLDIIEVLGGDILLVFTTSLSDIGE